MESLVKTDISLENVSTDFVFMPGIIHLSDSRHFDCCTENVQIHVQQAAECRTVELITTGTGGLIG